MLLGVLLAYMFLVDDLDRAPFVIGIIINWFVGVSN